MRGMIYAKGLLWLSLCGWWAAAPAMDPVESLHVALRSVEQDLAESHVQWPAEWQKVYVDTIREAAIPYATQPGFAPRCEILEKGFPLFWQHISKSPCSAAQFEVYRAEIRWYMEFLMTRDLPTDDAKSLLRSQYHELLDYAGRSLQKQLPGLEPEVARACLQDQLQQCRDRIAAPLMPIYAQPLTNAQMQAIRTDWDQSREERADWWIGWAGNARRRPPAGAGHPETHPHYLFTARCLQTVPASIWRRAAQPPDDFLQALQRRRQEVAKQQRDIQQQREAERQLRLRFGTRDEQVEQWTFILTAVLETTAAGRTISVPRRRDDARPGEPGFPQPEEVVSMR